jgi:hypothetical protein
MLAPASRMRLFGAFGVRLSLHLSRRDGQRASLHPLHLSRCRAKRSESQVMRTFALRGAACEAAPRNPPSVAPRMVETMATCKYEGRRNSREGPTLPLAGSAYDGREMAPHLQPRRAPLGHRSDSNRKNGEFFRMTYRSRSPSRRPPRRGTPSRQPGCFPSSGNPAHGECWFTAFIA